MWLYSRTYVLVGNNLVYIGAKFNPSLKAVIQKLLMQVFRYEIKQKWNFLTLVYTCFLAITAIEALFSVENHWRIAFF